MRRFLQPLVALAAVLVLGAAVLREEFVQDFRDGKFTDSALSLIGHDVSKTVIKEADGLRISLPGRAKGTPATGVMPRFRLGGDFEISLTYEIVHLDLPTRGYGSGVMIWVDGGQGVGNASVARMLRPKRDHAAPDTNIFIGYRGPLVHGVVHHQEQVIPAVGKTGRLGLRRSGAELIYSCADATDEPLREFHKADFTDWEIGSFGVNADPGGASEALEVRLLDLQVRAEEMTGEGVGIRPERQRGWALWGIAALACVCVSAFALIVYSRRRRAQRPDLSGAH